MNKHAYKRCSQISMFICRLKAFILSMVTSVYIVNRHNYHMIGKNADWFPNHQWETVMCWLLVLKGEIV